MENEKYREGNTFPSTRDHFLYASVVIAALRVVLFIQILKILMNQVNKSIDRNVPLLWFLITFPSFYKSQKLIISCQ